MAVVHLRGSNEIWIRIQCNAISFPKSLLAKHHVLGNRTYYEHTYQWARAVTDLRAHTLRSVNKRQTNVWRKQNRRQISLVLLVPVARTTTTADRVGQFKFYCYHFIHAWNCCVAVHFIVFCVCCSRVLHSSHRNHNECDTANHTHRHTQTHAPVLVDRRPCTSTSNLLISFHFDSVADPDKYKDECQCPGCLKKRKLIANAEPYKFVKELLVKLVIIAGWVLLGYLTYRVSQFDYELSNFDPYEILGLPPSASSSEIKRAYRKLSLLLHPDKETGDEKAFMKLSKAYQALTDEESRKNWEKYGNPDGPGAMSFGIALPSWIVEKENSVWVLGLYALVFMVALPVAVGTWWYRSIRFSGDKVLLDTTQLYLYFFHKTPQMAMKRVIMILAASMEFDKRHNSQIIERPSDNDEVPAVSKDIQFHFSHRVTESNLLLLLFDFSWSVSCQIWMKNAKSCRWVACIRWRRVPFCMHISAESHWIRIRWTKIVKQSSRSARISSKKWFRVSISWLCWPMPEEVSPLFCISRSALNSHLMCSFISSIEIAEHRDDWKLHETVADDHPRPVGIQEYIFAIAIRHRRSSPHVHVEETPREEFATICAAQTRRKSTHSEAFERLWVRASDSSARQNATHRF